MLMNKLPPIDHFDFQFDRLKNLEAMALSYIFATLLIVFIYDTPTSEYLKDPNTFRLNEWIKHMQTGFVGLKRITSG